MRPSSRRTAFALGIAALGASASPLGAQVVDSTAARARGLPPVVVTAARIPIPTPSVATDVVTAVQLRALGVTNLADALRDVAGVQIVQTGSFGGQTSLYLRGGQSGYTRVLIDGVPANDPGGDIDLSWLGVEDVERIEIARGPASVLYGSDAVSGVIQVFTKRRGRFAESAEFAVGDFRTIDSRFSVTTGTADHGLVLSGQRYTTAGTYVFNDGYTRNDLTASLDVPAVGAAQSRLLLKYSDAVAHIPTDGTVAVRDHNAFQYTPRLLTAVRSTKRFAGFDGTLSLSTSMSSGGYDNAPDGPGDTLGFFAFRSTDEIARRTADGFVARAMGRNTLVAGATLEDETQHSATHSGSQFGSADGTLDAYRSTRAAYATLNGNVARTSWSAGVRVDDNSAFGRFATYRAGLAQAIGTVRLRASAGNAFREPSFTENFATGFAIGNPRLRPEHTVSAEVGADLAWRPGRSQVSVTAFVQRFRDLIEYTFATREPGDPNFENIAAAHANGVELSAHAAPFASLTLAATVTRLLTRVDRAGFDSSATGFYRPGARLLRRADLTESASATYALPRGGSAMVRWLGVGSRDDIDYASSTRVTLPAVHTIDASLRLAILSPFGSTVFGVTRVSNASNVRYEAVKGFPAPGRLLLIGGEIER